MTVDQSRNVWNKRFIMVSVDDIPPINQSRHSATAMMMGVVAKDSKSLPPFWFPRGTKEYLEYWKDVVNP